MKHETILCPHPDGAHHMAYTEWGTPSAQPTIICVHGLTRNGRDFDRLASALELTGRHIICPDITGRGQSDFLADPTLYTYPQYIADINALLAAKNIRQTDWVGTSMGGLIGMMLASAKDSPIRRLILNDVGPYIPLAALQRIAAYVAMTVEFTGPRQLERHIRQIYAPFGITRDEDWRHLTACSTRILPNGKRTLAHDPAIAKNFSTLDKDLDIWPIYDAITCPTLLLRGENSDVLAPAIATAMTQRGPKAKLIAYPNIGHAPALMNEQQITDIINFLK